MLQTKSVIKLSNLINDCVVMIQQAGQLVQQTHRESAYANTQAARRQNIAEVDLHIRQTYLHNLTQLFPGLQLVCEGEEPISEPHFELGAFIEPDQLLETRKSKILTPTLLERTAISRTQQTQAYKDQLAQVMQSDAASIDLLAGAYTENLQTKDVAVWIDPIDGSKAFADGDLEHVTNMIGITVRGRPLVGIIHKPFSNQNRNSARTYVGSAASGLFYFDHSKQDQTTSSPTYVAPFESDEEKKQAKSGHYQPAVMMSSDKTEETMMKSVLRDLMPLKVNKVKGPGNKFLHLTNERSDFFLNLVPGYSMWDICASEAIFASRGGILTDAKQTPLFYDSSRRSFGLFNGVVAARNADIYLSAKDKYESKSGSTLAQSQTQIRRDVHLRNQELSRKSLAQI